MEYKKVSNSLVILVLIGGWFLSLITSLKHHYRYVASSRPGSGKLLQRYDHIVAGTLKFIFLYIQVFLNSYPHPTFID